jgi:hypothetical protein
LAKRDGITGRYIRRLVGLTFLSPELVEAILQGRQPIALLDGSRRMIAYNQPIAITASS